VLFTLTYLAFGKDFLHGGNYYTLSEESALAGAAPARRAPAYIPPETLLAEPTVDRMVPLR
jgi:hypothetical protein